jgi:hypothetical protein
MRKGEKLERKDRLSIIGRTEASNFGKKGNVRKNDKNE